MKYVRKWSEFSDDGRYRWLLGRQWSEDASLPWMHFTMLNPSYADGEDDDPTIVRCGGFAMREECGGLLVTNMSSYCATDPKDFLSWVKRCERAGQLNERWGIATDNYIRDCAMACRFNVAAWGANADHQTLQQRARLVLALLECYAPNGVSALELTKSGAPSHPLMLPGSLRPKRFPVVSTVHAGGPF